MWTPTEIEDRLEEAALTLRRLPNPLGSGSRGFGSSWPETVRSVHTAYGYERARMRVVPSAREISRMDEAIGWLRLIKDPDDRRIVWMRAEGHRWRSVGIAAGVVRQTAWRRWTAALLTIAKRLNEKEKGAKRRAAAKRAAAQDDAAPRLDGV